MPMKKYRVHRHDITRFLPELKNQDLTAVQKIWFHYKRIFVYVNNGEQSRLYAMGNNAKGLLGLGHDRYVGGPEELACFRDIAIEDIAAGQKHVLLLATNGDIYGWGSNTCKQIGKDLEGDFEDGEFKHSYSPVKIRKQAQHLSTDRVTKIRAGWQHSAAVQCDGRVLIWGNNLFGRLGLGIMDDRDVSVPTQIPTLGCIVRVELGIFQTLALTHGKHAFIWGENGWLEDVDPTAENTAPRLVKLPESKNLFTAIACANQLSAVLEDKTCTIYVSYNGKAFERVVFFDYILSKAEELMAVGTVAGNVFKYFLLAEIFDGAFSHSSDGDIRLWEGHDYCHLYKLFKKQGFAFPYPINVYGPA